MTENTAPNPIQIIRKMIEMGATDEQILQNLKELGVDSKTAMQLLSAGRREEKGYIRTVLTKPEIVIDSYKSMIEGVEIEVDIIQRPGDFVLEYFLNFPEYGSGTKALLVNLKNSIISDSTIRTEKMLDPKFIFSLKQKFREKASHLLDQELPNVDPETKKILTVVVLQEMLGLGKIEFLLADSNLEEIVINSAQEPVWVYHKKFGWLKTNIFIQPEEEIQNFASIIARRVGKQISVLSPLLDAHLITGDRANATLFPISSRGNTITIRRFRRDPWTVVDFIKNKTVNSEIMALIWLAMQYEMNIIVSGGTASGKCVSGDTKVIANGRLVPIKQIVDESFAAQSPVQTADGYWNSPAKIEVLSLNPQNTRVEKAGVGRAWKRQAPATLLKITTQTGKELTVTPEHPFFILGKESCFEKKRADELAEGLFIPAIRKIEIEPQEMTILTPVLNRMQRKIVNSSSWIKSGNSGRWARIPQAMSAELARFIGYVLGDGHITKDHRCIRFFNNDKRLREDFKQCGENLFGLQGKNCKYNTRCPYIEFSSRAIAEFLIQAFSVPPGKKSHHITIPAQLMSGKPELLKECVRALFECEAAIDPAKGELEFSSASPYVIDDLSTALHRFGILHCMKKKASRNRLFIAGKPLQGFREQIGFLRADKNDLLAQCKKETFSPNFDFIPGTTGTLQFLKKKLRVIDRQLAGKLSREAISRYLNEKRNPTRESLQQVVLRLEERFNDLQREKERFNDFEQNQQQQQAILLLSTNLYKQINLTRKQIAEKSGLNITTLWLWENERVKFTSDTLERFAQAVTTECDAYCETLQKPVSDLQTAHDLGLTAQFLSEKTGLSLRTAYKQLSNPSMTPNASLSLIQQWQNEQLERLGTLQQQASKIKKLLRPQPNAISPPEIMSLEKKLLISPILRKKERRQLLRQHLEEATSTEVQQKIEWLKQLSTSNILWDKIKKIETVKPKEPWVYDLTVEPNHTFLANNLFAHNTSILNVMLPFIQPNQRIISIEDSVSGESEIVFEKDGQTAKTTVGELIDSIIEDDSIQDAIVENDEGIRIPSMTKAWKTEWKEPSHFIRHWVKKDLLKITLKSGRTVEVTPDHSLFSLNEEGKIVAISGNEIKTGTWLATPRQLDWQGQKVKFRLQEHLKAFEGCFVKSIEIKPILQEAKAVLRTRFNKQVISHAIKKNSVRVEMLAQLQAFPETGWISSRLGTKIPLEIEIDEDLACFVGLWLADGCYDKNSVLMSVVEPEARKTIEHVAERFGVKPKMHSDGITIMLNSKPLKQFFERVLELQGNAFTKKMPSWIFTLEKPLAAAVLRGYFSGDGWVRKNDIAIRSSSKQLLQDTRTLLLRFGIPLRVKWNLMKDKTFEARVSGTVFLKKFVESVGFTIDKKTLAAEKWRTATSHDVSDVIPLPKHFYKEIKKARKVEVGKTITYKSWKTTRYRNNNIGRNTLQAVISKYEDQLSAQFSELAFNDLFWDPVENIERKPFEGFVYDFSVPENESFVCNNIVCHNTRELLLPDFLHWVPMTTREATAEGKGSVEMLDLLVNSLRMRPDRIIVGEVRRQREAEVMFEGMHTGHSVYTTFHANTAEETIRRMTNPPLNVPASMLDSVHLNLVMFRNRRLGVRRVLQIAEFIPEKRGSEEIVRANVLYRWRPSTDEIVRNAESIRFEDELSLHTGMNPQAIREEIKTKQRILEWMVSNNLHNINQVGRAMAEYYMDEEKVLNWVQKGTIPDFLKKENLPSTGEE